jgi:SAM-dependent methyltransferase
VTQQDDLWAAGEAYEPYVGRWSRLVAPEFVRWLDPPESSDWTDVGCGTGELTKAILATSAPRSVRGVEPSEAFIAYARDRVRDDRVTFAKGNALELPCEDASADVVVSGLVLNFVGDQPAAIAEAKRVARDGGTIAAYVWDYADKMQMMRYFFDAAVELNAAALEHDEGRFPICNADALNDLFVAGGLQRVDVQALDVPTVFANFDDYWTPFLAGGAPAPRYAMSLTPPQREELRALLQQELPTAADGSISLVARAWAVKGTVNK